MAERGDRRVHRTRELLRTALFSLIREKGFEELSVQEIIDRANVGRATFYAHFDNKEDLLLSGFDTLLTSLKERQREARVRSGSTEKQVLASATNCSRTSMITVIYSSTWSASTAALQSKTCCAGCCYNSCVRS